jgi:hypothetical protein
VPQILLSPLAFLGVKAATLQCTASTPQAVHATVGSKRLQRVLFLGFFLILRVGLLKGRHSLFTHCVAMLQKRCTPKPNIMKHFLVQLLHAARQHKNYSGGAISNFYLEKNNQFLFSLVA